MPDRTDLLDSPGDTLTAVECALAARRRAEADVLLLAAHWADQHGDDPTKPWGYVGPGGECAIQLGGEGTPLVQEFSPAELGISLEIHPVAARHLIADMLDLRHRLPSLWQLVTVELSMPDWVARKVATRTRQLTGVQVLEVDHRLAEIAATLPPSRLFNVVEAMVLAADTATADERRARARASRFATLDREAQNGVRHLYARLDDDDALRLDASIALLADALAASGDDGPVDLRRAKALGLLATPARALQLLFADSPHTASDPDRPNRDEDVQVPGTDLAELLQSIPVHKLGPAVTLYLHLTESDFTRDGDGVARFEQGGPITLAHARGMLGHANVTIKPVIDLAHQLSSDAYEFTGSLREAILLRTPADCFPYAVNTTGRRDLDHTRPYQPNGPPGQTNTGNGGPLARYHHRIRTHGSISVRQPRPGVYLWRTRHGRYRLSDHRGTRAVDPALGRGFFSESEFEQALATMMLDDY